MSNLVTRYTPQIYFASGNGKLVEGDVDWRKRGTQKDPDDETLRETSEDVTALLGFDPLEFATAGERRLAVRKLGFDPSQPRDASGRWTDGGGSIESGESSEQVRERLRNEYKELVEDPDFPTDPHEAIESLNLADLEEAYPEIYSYYFGDPAKFRGVVYHHTPTENLEDIRKDGLMPRRETRGFTNRGTGSAVFTSAEIDPLATYGEVIIAIDVGALKDSNPDITTMLEEPISEDIRRGLFASEVGVEWTPGLSTSDGLREDTLIIQGGDIPPDFLEIEDSQGHTIHSGGKFSVTKFSPDQPRYPRGHPMGGQWKPSGASAWAEAYLAIKPIEFSEFSRTGDLEKDIEQAKAVGKKYAEFRTNEEEALRMQAVHEAARKLREHQDLSIIRLRPEGYEYNFKEWNKRNVELQREFEHIRKGGALDVSRERANAKIYELVGQRGSELNVNYFPGRELPEGAQKESFNERLRVGNEIVKRWVDPSLVEDVNNMSKAGGGIAVDYNVLGGRASFKHIPESVYRKPEGESSYRRVIEDTYKVQIGPGTKPTVVAHEFVHGIEYAREDISQRSKEFVKSRNIVGQGLIPLATVDPAYRSDEQGYEDHWYARGGSVYSGKDYSSTNPATEVLTMGIERLERNAVEFAANDPGYFDYVTRVFNGQDPATIEFETIEGTEGDPRLRQAQVQ